jgi:hypothetical protein
MNFTMLSGLIYLAKQLCSIRGTISYAFRHVAGVKSVTGPDRADKRDVDVGQNTGQRRMTVEPILVHCRRQISVR